MKIALVDTAHANLRSVERALLAASAQLSQKRSAQIEIIRTHDPEVVLQADKVVVPGQGGFGECMAALRRRGLSDALLQAVKAGTPYLGICLGLQALFESSPEAPGVDGLGLLAGHCEQLTPAPGIKIPHMGWNELNLHHGGHPALERAGGEGTWVYFVHSFHGVPTDPTLVKASVSHGPHQVTAAVARDNLFATQFHPEKSQQVGLNLLEGFLSL